MRGRIAECCTFAPNFTMFVRLNHISKCLLLLFGLLTAEVACAASMRDTLVVEADTILMRELTVTGALHPVTMHGDTVVYDVSSFSLPVGSRLRELLLRLPGVEVTSDGTIKAQGLNISCLLLNGRDFFSGNRTIVLDNLPADVLLDIRVYDRVKKDEEDTGLRSHTERVMDLSTAPNNNRGWFADITAAGGYDRRYSGNASASRFDEQHQHMITVALDNLPEAFGLGDSFYDKMEKSVATSDPHHRNVSAVLGKKTERWDMSGSVSYSNTKASQKSESMTEHILSTGHLFSRASTEGVEKTHSVAASGHFERRDSMMTISLDPQLSWTRFQDENHYLNYSSTRALGDLLESSDIASTSPFLLNRQISDNDELIKSWDAAITAHFRRRLSAKGRTLTATASWSLTDLKATSSVFSDTYYYRTGQDNRQLRTSNRPDRDLQTRLRLAWIEPLGKYFKLKGEYSVSYRTERIREAVYADSVYSEQRSRDASYRYLNQVARLLMQWSPSENLYLAVGGNYNPVRSSIHYLWQGRNLSKTNFVDHFAPEMNFYYRAPGGWNITAQYTGSSRQPALLNLLPIIDDTDPLHIQVGNPSLKPSFLHQATATFFWFDQDTQTQLNLQAQGQWELNAMTDVIELDRTEGVRRTSVSNVDGCRQFGAAWTVTSDFAPESRWTIDFQGDLVHARRVGLQEQRAPQTLDGSSAVIIEEQPFVTHHTLLRQFLALQWRPGIVSVKPYAFCSYNGLRTEKIFQTSSNLWLWGVGLICRLETANGWSAAIDASRQSRRGYLDAVDNDNEWLIDFEVAYAFLKGRAAEVRLQVCDLLHQRDLARTQTSVSERMESAYPHGVTNYILLSFTYRFSLMGK